LVCHLMLVLNMFNMIRLVWTLKAASILLTVPVLSTPWPPGSNILSLESTLCVFFRIVPLWLSLILL
jgi:hypothetical protein